jgi:hypothetical protein
MNFPFEDHYVEARAGEIARNDRSMMTATNYYGIIFTISCHDRFSFCLTSVF